SDAAAQFAAAMDDDFNTPEALAVLQGLATELNRAKAAGDGARSARLAGELRHLGGVLGLLQQPPEQFLRKQRRQPQAAASHRESAAQDAAPAPSLSEAEIEALVAERAAARKAKNFQESDRIRDVLAR